MIGGVRSRVGGPGWIVVAAVLACGVSPAVAQQRPALPADSLAWLVAVATDSGSDLESRAAALRSLRGQCADLPVAALVRLGRPYLEPWVIWRGALGALAQCAREDLASFWRELLVFPRRPVRELAIEGLARTGLEGDRPQLREATHRESDPHLRRLAAWADSLLGLPIGERARHPPPR